jgi:endonuclease/exonuclease/phosphatase (EEP) superfamily protein YafD
MRTERSTSRAGGSVIAWVFVLSAAVLTLATLLPLFRHDAWWVRVFDFPRLQVAGAGLIVAGLYVALREPAWRFADAAIGVLLLCVVYQAARMRPYSRLASKQVVDARDVHGDAAFTLLIANVLMDLRNAADFLALVREHDPDIVLAVEPDEWWEAQLRGLETNYHYVVRQPLPNTYGMLLYSRLPLIDPVVSFLIDPDVPSIRALVELPCGARFALYCLHPKPPYPREDTATTRRDAELLLVGEEVRRRGEPSVVAGDLNDVAWSHTTHLFQKISGLLDPRIGRGLFNTFHAAIPLLRFPLDHVFHSNDFKLMTLMRLPGFGSDHFPILVRLAYDAKAPRAQPAPDADAVERQAADEKIERAAPDGGPER